MLGWDARSAHSILGTSAGAQVGALLRAGMAPSDVAARASARPMTPHGAEIAQHYIRPAHRLPDPNRPRKLVPASPEYLARTARRPWRLRAGRFVSALLPEGRVSLHEQASGLRRVFGHAWPARELHINAVQLETGRIVTFGAPGAPQTDVGTAVACSGAVPGVCAPLSVGGRRYVDGGMASATHLDRLNPDVDVAIVISPLSMFRAMRWLLRAEVRRLRERGTEVVVFEPEGEALQAMGNNPMVMARSPQVVDAAYRTAKRAVEGSTAGALRRLL
jgi:NTE family protein